MIKRISFLIGFLLICSILVTFSTYVPWYVGGAHLDRGLYPLIPRSIKGNYKFDPISQHRGALYWSGQKVIVCGMLRDGESAMGYMKSQIMELVSYFSDYLILIVENDSIDSTRSQLLDWSRRDSRVRVLGCGGVNLPSCHLSTDRTQWHSQCPTRITKMAVLRNIYLDYIRSQSLDQEYGFTVVLDADLRGVLYREGVLDTGSLFSLDDDRESATSNAPSNTSAVEPLSGSMDESSSIPETGRSSIDGISANGWFVVADHFFPCYMDSYAHEELGVSTPFTHETIPPLFHFWNRRLLDVTSPCRRVVSGFGGLAFYRTSRMITSSYSSGLNTSGRPICEHKFLHYGLQMWFNPKLLYLITSNPLL